ncbi:LPS-assembly protein LptD [Edaphobacter sp. HDX4]|uniref:LPS-assembly protein LptD n=1 Tax=Edaphobacter sp. HDX4 TaxID=2794064 RepID=UPI002FE6118A
MARAQRSSSGARNSNHPAGADARKRQSSALLRGVYLLITITGAVFSHPQLLAQGVSNQEPSLVQPQNLPEGPDTATQSYPDAILVPAPDDDTTVVIESSGPQKKTGSRYTLDRDVVITYRDRRVEADHIDYDSDTGELNASGHLKVTGGQNSESISASHGTMNLKTQTGRFFDVKGTVGFRPPGQKPLYDNGQPFIFEGRIVVKTGPRNYDVYDGSVTSCQLPRPDWQLFAGRFSIAPEKATAKNVVFRVINIPLIYLPYASHPVGGEERQSGFLIPVIGESSTRGLILGEQIYLVLGRSADMTVGAEYFSKRGWEQSATLRYRGAGNNFALGHYSGLLDRGYVTGGTYVNQGGQDAVFSGRYDISPQTRFVSDVEYLSSYPYRQAFAENFNQAVSSDILSIVYGVHQAAGYSMGLRVDRYQGLKRAATATQPEEQVRIFHSPSLDLSTTEHRFANFGALWNIDSSVAALKRVQPNFATIGLTERFDIHPELAFPFKAGGWSFRPSIGVRDTIYTRSREHSPTNLVPQQSGEAVNRADVEIGVEARAPVLERTFSSPLVHRLFGSDVKHTIEPMVAYHMVSGVDNFRQLLRFDQTDVVSDTNEIQYGLTQRLFLHRKSSEPCPSDDAGAAAGTAAWTGAAAAGVMGGVGGDVASDAGYVGTSPSPACGSRELLSWRLTQKYFFDPHFGGAVVTGSRNIFQTTLDLSGVAFLTEPREISPLISRLRWRTSDHFDVEWDFDVDTGAKKFTSNNVLVNFHEGQVFSGLSYARLNAPGRFNIAGFSSEVSDFNQLRVLLGYGGPTKRGFGIAANTGLDLNRTEVQYGALQVQYNWDCCGLSVEYRKYELGAVRNENAYRFNFTLANIGTAGNLRRAERLF